MTTTENKRKTVFVTVGTTKFDELIQCVTDDHMLSLLDSLGFGLLVLQIGAGTFTPVRCDEDSEQPRKEGGGVSISWYRFKPDISEDIAAAHLVISHAGAGSILETLYAGRRLLVVVNDTLMNNHQCELAHTLREGGYLRYTYCRSLPAAVREVCGEDWQPRHFPQGDANLLPTFLNNYLGVA